MEKEKPKLDEYKSRKKAPVVPDLKFKLSDNKSDHDPFAHLQSFKDREDKFLEALKESIDLTDKENNDENADGNCSKMSDQECRDYIDPLLGRTRESISTLLATRDSLDQLDNLHRIVKRLLIIQEQNFHMRKRLATVRTLQALKTMEMQMNNGDFRRQSDGSDFDMNEIEENMANIENIMAAATSASNKRNSSKKLRSKSIISEDNFKITARDNDRNYPLRRQSAISDFKPKVSKWTKVKAAFKWEKTNALSESKSSDSVLSPNNSELARYLRVPPTPHGYGCSSGESMFSLSSGRVGTPPELSSSENEDEKSSRNRNSLSDRYQNSEDRRSHSLDGDGEPSKAVLEHQKLLIHLDKTKNKSTWNKVKMIVANRTSRKSVKSNGSNNSRDVSPIENLEYSRDRADSLTSSPSYVGAYNLSIPEYDYFLLSHNSSDDNESKSLENRQGKSYRGSKKTKHVPEIESLPEGVPFEKTFKQKPIPKPLNLQQVKYDDDLPNPDSTSPSPAVVIRPNKGNSSSSVPNSPQQSETFEFPSLQRGGSNSSKSSQQHDEILKNYQELQRKINTEFEMKKTEWQKIRPLVVQLNNALPSYCLKEDLSQPNTPKNIISNITLNEESLSPDFKKKLDEWRTRKSQQSQKSSPRRVGQGVIPLPDPKDLPEGFQKKMNEWKQMKTEGRIPTYTNQTSVQERMKRQFSKNDSKSSSSSSSMKKSKTYDDKSDGLYKLKSLVSEPAAKDIVVQTSKGTMVFQGISRKFTRKLVEWEKAKGIGPELSTFALLDPEYKATSSRQVTINDNIEGTREKSPLKRCLSVDSLKPLPNLNDFQMSHQPSSLSLNDAENFKENENERRTVSSTEIKEPRDNSETDHYEPEALLVEIEDESFETLPPVPEPVVTPSGLPIFKFDFAIKNPKREDADCKQTLKEVFKALENGSNTILDFYKTNEIAITTIKHLTNLFKYISHSLVQLRESSKEHSSALLFEALKLSNEIATDFEEVDNSFNEKSLLQKLPAINAKTLQLKEALVNFEVFYLENRENAVKGFQAIRTIQSSDDDNKAVATVTTTFTCAVEERATAKAVQVKKDTSDKSGEETSSKKVARNLSNGSKRKVRLRRMGSRQSSKTESDSENDLNQNQDVSRKVKRKTSRAKKQAEPEKVPEISQSSLEKEVTYVFKIKPGEVNEVTTKPTEIVEQVVEATTEACQSGNFSNAIIKTKRKIFTPVEDGAVKITFSQELESSSDRSENDKKDQENPGEQQKENAPKDLSPSIRLMINRYKSNVEKNSSSPNSPGSISPIWRSPILDRRVRKQSNEYQEKISKSLEIAREKMEIVKNEQLAKEENEENCRNDEEQEINDNEMQNEVNSRSKENLIEIIASKGAIPKVIDSNISPPVTMRNDINKPRTPLSERAIKIRQAKEAFLRMPVISHDSSQSDWSYRLSQISVGSTDTDDTGSLNKSQSNKTLDDKISPETKSLSLPRSSNSSDMKQEPSKASRFGFTSLATKLRKVKLKRNSREVQKMNTVPVLCRASLAVDFSLKNGSDPSRLLPNKSGESDRNIKKSKSLGILDDP